jgi:hypothetical protein
MHYIFCEEEIEFLNIIHVNFKELRRCTECLLSSEEVILTITVLEIHLSSHTKNQLPAQKNALVQQQLRTTAAIGLNCWYICYWWNKGFVFLRFTEFFYFVNRPVF